MDALCVCESRNLRQAAWWYSPFWPFSSSLSLPLVLLGNRHLLAREIHAHRPACCPALWLCAGFLFSTSSGGSVLNTLMKNLSIELSRAQGRRRGRTSVGQRPVVLGQSARRTKRERNAPNDKDDNSESHDANPDGRTREHPPEQVPTELDLVDRGGEDGDEEGEECPEEKRDGEGVHDREMARGPARDRWRGARER